MENNRAVIELLLVEAKHRELSEHDAIQALMRVLLQNEGYRRKPSRQGKKTQYDQFLEETQPALALAWELLCQHQNVRGDLP